jgi:bacterioferritin (cytochrome b1)
VTILEKLRTILSPHTRLIQQLAQIAGDNERLAGSLKRHASLCDFPRLKSGLEMLAAAERADADVLRQLVLAHNAWPLPPLLPNREGANNWERLSFDLAAQVELVRSLNSFIAQCERTDPSMAQQLRALVNEKERASALLRDITLKCDPQALD